jgi:glutaminyl-tRNA synthetase
VDKVITDAGDVSDGAESPVRQRQDFIRSIVADDLRAGRHSEVVTRFPPEPNGYLHIGHAKAIALNFGIAGEFGGRCHLRFDDTNPETEDAHYVESIIETVRWLGYEWGEHLYYASDYFDEMYRLAEYLIENGEAYVDSSSEEEIRERRGSVTEPGEASPYRERSPGENRSIFRRMRAGEFENGAHVLRAKIDMASPNMLMRDPLLYRIRHAHHYRTDDRWCIYPMYDFAHSIEDAIECITHSLCTLEFENNRPLYDWVVERWVGFRRAGGGSACAPRQFEFARGNLEYTVLSKRRLLALVKGGHVSGWDDPRMPTLAGLRRRGVTPESIRAFWERIGVAKFYSRVDIGKLEYAIRDDLNHRSPRVLCVLEPIKVVITNYPADRTEQLDAPHWPHDVPREGSRKVPFGRELFIDRADFSEKPPKGYHRLAPGSEVRLRYAYVIRCDEVIRDAGGEVIELRCSYDPKTRSGNAPDRRAVKGTIHWVSAPHALRCEVRLYDRLFSVPNPDDAEDFLEVLNPDSLIVIRGARIEPSVADDPPGSLYQFERHGYFVSDSTDSRAGSLVFNRTVTLRDTWTRSRAPSAGSRRGGAEAKPRAARKPRSSARVEAAGSGTRPVRTPELQERMRRYMHDHGLAELEASVLTRDSAIAEFFEAALAVHANAKAVANWVVHELPREIGDRTFENLPFSAGALGRLVGLIDEGTISSTAGREVLATMVEGGGDPAEIVAARNLLQVSRPEALIPLVEESLAAHPGKADEYRAGKKGLLGFFVGQVMRSTQGAANPELVRDLFLQRLESDGDREE